MMGKGEKRGLVVDETLLSNMLAAEYDKVSQKLLSISPTIVLLGSTGAGKSSIINAVFGEQRAPVGNGRPKTQTFEYYEPTADRPIHLYDSKGFEPLDSTFIKNLDEFLKTKAKEMQTDIAKGIHCIWYVVNMGQTRWSQGDTKIINEILNRFPVIALLNKCDLAKQDQIDAVVQTIQAEVPNIKGIIQISASPTSPLPPSCPVHGDDNLTIRKKDQTWKCNECEVAGAFDYSPWGLQELVHLTELQMPEIVKSAFINAQAQNLLQKDRYAYRAIAATTAAAYVVGWTPIPFSDAPILIGIQLGLASTLAFIYKILKSMIIPVLTGQLSAAGVGYTGASLFKLIPGVGTVVGGLIDSSFAASMTLATGVVYHFLFRKVYREVAQGTAEERTTRLVKLLENIDIVSIVTKIRSIIAGKVDYSNKDDLARMMPSLGNEIAIMVE